jgi:hypothetical protein
LIGWKNGKLTKWRGSFVLVLVLKKEDSFASFTFQWERGRSFIPRPLNTFGENWKKGRQTCQLKARRKIIGWKVETKYRPKNSKKFIKLVNYLSYKCLCPLTHPLYDCLVFCLNVCPSVSPFVCIPITIDIEHLLSR